MGLLDRGPLQFDRIHEPSPRKQRTLGIALALLVFSCLIMMGLASLNGHEEGLQKGDADDPPNHAWTTYTHHGPISIYGDAGFLGDNASTGVARGSGTEADPYIVEGWDIDGPGDTGILISGTSAHLVIRFCFVHDLGPMGTGIYLIGDSNVTLDGNVCPGNVFGIYNAALTNGSITDNNCSGNTGDGIAMFDSDSNTVANNNCSSNGGAGIRLMSSSEGNTVRYNNCWDNFWGVNLTSSDYNIVFGNNCNLNREGMGLGFSHGTIAGNVCSLNVNVGMRLWSSNDNFLLNNTLESNGGGGIHLGESSRNLVSGNTCSNSTFGSGITVAGDSNEIENNTCCSNSDGIVISDSKDNRLSNNNCSLNSHNGIYAGGGGLNTNTNNSVNQNVFYHNIMHGVNISRGLDNTIWNNTFIDNNGAGDTYNPTRIQAYDGGTENWWNDTVGFGNYWSDWTSPDVVPPMGIVDVPYSIGGSAGSQDLYPLTTQLTQIPEFGLPSSVMAIGLAAIVSIIWRREGRHRE